MRSRFTLMRIDPLSAGKVLGALYLLVGVLQGIVIAIATLTNDGPVGQFDSSDRRKIVAGALLIFVPVVVTAIAFATGVLGALFYNLSVNFTGGLELECADDRYVDE